MVIFLVSIITMAYGDQKGKAKSHAGRMTPAQHKKFSKAVKDGIITKGQHDKLSAGLLEAIIKKKKGKNNKKK
tara:strand:+ start:1432 stop:1650 length:219 start_codon:yes stop_codon:yes gene_type:complete